jgi:DNA-binding transcriptional LysR family regulator
MDMNRLRYFCVIVQTGSLTKASEILHISQPALSKSVKALEGELAKKLMVPSGRGIAVTDYGQKLYLEILPLLEKIDRLKSLDLNLGQSKRLNIAAFEVFTTYFLGKLVAENFIDYDVNIFELVPGPMEVAIVKGIADIGISYLPIPRPELDIDKITTIEMGIFGLTSKFRSFEFNSLPFVVPNVSIEGTPSKVKGLDGWPDHEIPRYIKYQVAMMETALDLCRRGICVGYFPKFVIELHNIFTKSQYMLSELSLPKGKKLESQNVFMIKRKSDLESSQYKKISKALRLIGLPKTSTT